MWEPETGAERGLIEAARTGSTFDAGLLEPADRIVRPAFLRALLAAPAAERLPFPGGRLEAIRLVFEADLDLSGLGNSAEPLPHLRLGFSRFRALRLDNSQLLGLSLHGADSGDLSLRNARILFDCQLSLLDVIGELSLHNARIGGNLSLNGTLIDGRPRRVDPATGETELPEPQAAYNALYADGAQIEGDVFLCPTRYGETSHRPFLAYGTVRFIGCRIAGDIILNGAQLIGPARTAANGQGLESLGRAATFDRSTLGGCIFAHPAEGYLVQTIGEWSLFAATVGGTIDIKGADLGFTISGDGPVSLDLGDAQAQALFLSGIATDVLSDGDLNFGYHPLVARGEIRLIGAQIRGQMNLSGVLLGAPGDGLCGHNMRVDGGVWLNRPIELDGEVPPDRQPPDWSVRTNGRFTLSGATLRRVEIHRLLLAPTRAWPFRSMLDLAGATISQDFIISLHPESRGKVSLENAHVGNLPKVAASDWGAPPTSGPDKEWAGVLLDLDELTYDRADVARQSQEESPNLPWWRRLGGNSDDSDHLLAWLNRQYPDGTPTRETLRPQPFEQAARLLRAKGDRYGAGRIASAKRQLQRRSKVDRGLGWLGNWLFYTFFDYGYSPARALAWGILFVAAGVIGTATLQATGGLVTIERQPVLVIDESGPNPRLVPEERTAEVCDISALGYALDTFLPIVDLGFDGRCEINERYPHARAANVLRLLYVFIGFIFVPVAALTFAGVLRSD